MRAVVLVGGEGTRLRPLTYTTPKQLLPVAEVTMIERVLGHLRDHGVSSAVLSMGYRPHAFLDAFPDGRVATLPTTYAVEPEPRDTGGGIAFAARAAGVDDTFVAVNGDVLTDVDVSALLALHRERGAKATIHLARVDDPSRFGVVPTDDTGRVLGFIEKPPRETAPTNWVNAGTYVLERDVLDLIADSGRVSIERDVFPALAEEGSLYALPSDAYWIDAGTPATYLQAQLDLLDGRRGPSPAAGAVPRDGGGWVLGKPVVDGHVDGSTLVGDAAFVAPGSTVRRSVIGAGARIHANATVADAVVLPGAAVRDDAVVEHSIVGEMAVIREGARVTGLSVIGSTAVVDAGATVDGLMVRG